MLPHTKPIDPPNEKQLQRNSEQQINRPRRVPAKIDGLIVA